MNDLKLCIRAILFATDSPLTLGEIISYLPSSFRHDKSTLLKKEVIAVINQLQSDSTADSITLVKVASGFRYQIDEDYAKLLGKTMNAKTVRYSNALLETLSIIVYKQPVTRGEVEEIRGVTVSHGIFRVLLDRGWVKIVGHRDSLGKPALYCTTPVFLDYFNLENLSQLPPLQAQSSDATE